MSFNDTNLYQDFLTAKFNRLAKQKNRLEHCSPASERNDAGENLYLYERNLDDEEDVLFHPDLGDDVVKQWYKVGCSLKIGLVLRHFEHPHTKRSSIGASNMVRLNVTARLMFTQVSLQ